MDKDGIEALVAKALRCTHSLNLLGITYNPSRLISMHGRYTGAEPAEPPPRIDDFSPESSEKARRAFQAYKNDVMKRKEKEDVIQAIVNDISALRASPAPQEKILQNLTKLRDLGVNLEFRVDAERVYSELKRMKEEAKRQASDLVPGAFSAYFMISGTVKKAESGFWFFKRGPKGIYSGPLSLDLVAQDLSRSYAVTDAQANFAQAKAKILGYFSEAHESFKAGDYRNAAASFEKILEMEPYPHVHKFVGDCYRHLGQHKEAIQHYKQAIKYDITGEAAAELHLRRKLWSSRASRMSGWLGKVGNAIGNAYARIERGDRILREQYARA